MKWPAFLTRLVRPSLPPMICRSIFDEICVLVNGDIVCSCADPSGFRVYGYVYRNRLADIYNGPAYQEMRRWQPRAKPDSWCSFVNTSCSELRIPVALLENISHFQLTLIEKIALALLTLWLLATFGD
jgi:hypothetical protein